MMPLLSLTYDDALSRASEKNPTVLRADADLAAADGAILAARTTYEPRFTLAGTAFSSREEGQFQIGDAATDTFVELAGSQYSAGLEQVLSTGTTFGVTMDATFNDRVTTFSGDFEGQSGDPAWSTKLAFTLSQSLLQGHRTAYNLQAVRSARRARSVLEATRQSTREKALADTAKAYWGLYYAGASEQIARQGLEQARGQAEVVRALVREGRLAGVEGTRVDAGVAQAEQAMLVAETATGAARDALLLLVGESPGREVSLLTHPPAPPELSLDADRVVEAVLQGNPDVIALRIALQSKDEAVRDARHALLPQLDATGTYALNGYEEELGDALGETGGGDLPSWSLGARLSLPLFNLGDRGALAEAKADATRATLDLRAMEGTVSEQARAQVRALVSARRTVDLTRLQVTLAEETLSAETARLSEGRSLPKDLVTARKDLDAARAEAEKALTDYQVAVVELERLKGTL